MKRTYPIFIGVILSVALLAEPGRAQRGGAIKPTIPPSTLLRGCIAAGLNQAGSKITAVKVSINGNKLQVSYAKEKLTEADNQLVAKQVCACLNKSSLKSTVGTFSVTGSDPRPPRGNQPYSVTGSDPRPPRGGNFKAVAPKVLKLENKTCSDPAFQ